MLLFIIIQILASNMIYFNYKIMEKSNYNDYYVYNYHNVPEYFQKIMKD